MFKKRKLKANNINIKYGIELRKKTENLFRNKYWNIKVLSTDAGQLFCLR